VRRPVAAELSIDHSEAMRITRIGGPTALVEHQGWRILTDPTFDPPGRRYTFGWGTSSRKTAGPAVALEDIGPVDVVLLSHDHHADNLDDLGRATLATATFVVTTEPGARRLKGSNTRGLATGATTTLELPGRPALRVTATPCRHGPRFSRPIAGKVIGFALAVGDAQQTALWMTGDSVLYGELREVAKALDVDTALVHLGSVQFGFTGPLRYSMTATEAVELLGLLNPRVAVPVHYEGWSHFRETEAHSRAALDGSPVVDRVRWLVPGVPAEV